VVFFAAGVASANFCWLLVVHLVLTELMAIFTIETELVTDSSSTLIFFHLARIVSMFSNSQYNPSSSDIATFSISLLLLQTPSSFCSQYASAAWSCAVGLNYLGTCDCATFPYFASSVHLMYGNSTTIIACTNKSADFKHMTHNNHPSSVGLLSGIRKIMGLLGV